MKSRFESIVTFAALLLLVQGAAQAQKIMADGIKDLATQIATNVTKEQKRKIAILPFRELDGQPTVLGTYISEELVTDLFTIGGLDIVERSMLDKLIGELKLSQTGLIDPETAREVGKIAGVDAIVTGTITDLQSYVALNCRLIDAQTGRIFSAAQTKIVKDDDLRKILGALLPAAGEKDQEKPKGSPAGSAPTRKPPVDLPQQQIESFLVVLKGCTLSGTSVTCDLLITNRGNDARFRILIDFNNHQSRIIGEDGDEYKAREVSLGTEKATGYVGSTLVSGIPMKASVTFGVSSEVKKAALLEIAVEGKDVYSVQFRSVPLTRP